MAIGRNFLFPAGPEGLDHVTGVGLVVLSKEALKGAQFTRWGRDDPTPKRL